MRRLISRAEHADATDSDPQALPEELARRETLKAKLDEALSGLFVEPGSGAVFEPPAGEIEEPLIGAPG